MRKATPGRRESDKAIQSDTKGDDAIGCHRILCPDCISAFCAVFHVLRQIPSGRSEMARSAVPGGSSSGRDKQSSVFSKLFLEAHKQNQTDSFFGKVLAIPEVFSVVLAIISLS